MFWKNIAGDTIPTSGSPLASEGFLALLVKPSKLRGLEHEFNPPLLINVLEKHCGGRDSNTRTH